MICNGYSVTLHLAYMSDIRIYIFNKLHTICRSHMLGFLKKARFDMHIE